MERESIQAGWVVSGEEADLIRLFRTLDETQRAEIIAAARDLLQEARR
jgi:hypothetical protein